MLLKWYQIKKTFKYFKIHKSSKLKQNYMFPIEDDVIEMDIQKNIAIVQPVEVFRRCYTFPFK